MALADFWELKDNQVFGGKPVLNIYHLKRIDGGATALVVAQAFIDSILNGPLDTLQPDGLSRTVVEVANLGTPTDFASLDSSAFPGLVVSEDLPSFNAATVQFNRTRTDMKNGSKRFLAGTESEQLNGEWNAGFITLLNTLATAITTPWELTASPGIDMVEFVILRRFCVDPLEDPCTVYRLPNTSVEIDAWHYVPLSFITRARVRSQVSRKVLQ